MTIVFYNSTYNDLFYKLQAWRKFPYRFSLLLNELRSADLITYRTTLMALINAIIVANEGLQDRVRIRNDFVCTFHFYTKLINQFVTYSLTLFAITCTLFECWFACLIAVFETPESIVMMNYSSFVSLWFAFGLTAGLTGSQRMPSPP